MKIGEIVASADALRRVAKEKLPWRVAYVIAINLRRVSDELQAFDAARIKMLEKYGTLNAEKGIYDVPDERKKAFDKDYQDLLDMGSEFVPRLVKLADLPEDARIDPADIAALLWMFEEM